MKILHLFAAIAAAVLLAGACSKSPVTESGPVVPAAPATPEGTPQSPSPGAAPRGADIVFSEVASLTGSDASFGAATKNGIQLALDEVNSGGGVRLGDGTTRMFAVRLYDDQSKPEEAAHAVSKGASEDKATVVIGGVAATSAKSMALEAQGAGVPLITLSSLQEVTAKGDYVFSVGLIEAYQGFAMAKFARDTLKLKSAAVLKDKASGYSDRLSSAFSTSFTSSGGSITESQTFNRDSMDFRRQLKAIKGKLPAGIYVPGYAGDVGMIARQVRELGMRTPLMGGDGWGTDRLLTLGGPALEGGVFTVDFSPFDPSARVQAFIGSYRAKYGVAPDEVAALAYDAAMLAVEAIRRIGGTDRSAIRDELARTKDHPGVTGTITIDATRNANKSVVVMQVQGGELKYKATVTGDGVVPVSAPLPVSGESAPARSPAAVFCDAWEASFDAALETDGAASSFDAFNHTPAGKAFLAAYNKAAYGKGASDDEACEAAYAVARRVGRMP